MITSIRSNPYLESKIYKITCQGYPGVYIGSTHDTLHNRFVHHTSHYRSWKLGKGNFTASYVLFERGPCTIELVENWPCQTKKEKLAREQYWLKVHRNVMVNIVFDKRLLTPNEEFEFHDRCVWCECGVKLLPNQVDAHVLTLTHINNLRRAAERLNVL